MNSFLVFLYKIFTNACMFSNVPFHSPRLTKVLKL